MAESKTPAKATIYIDVEDEITSIIDKMENAGQKVVAMVLPKRSSSLQSIVNMRLLKRSADNAEKNVVLITSEEALLPLAGAAGLHVAESLSSKPYVPPAPSGLGAPPKAAPKKASVEEPEAIGETEETAEEMTDEQESADLPTKIDYKKSIGELAATHGDEHETIELGDEEDPVEAAAAASEKLPKAPKSSKIKVPNFDKFRLVMGLGAAGLLALIIFIYLAVAVLPHAVINIQTTSTPVSASFSLATSDKAKGLDEKTNTIQSFLKTSDQTGNQSVPATGQQNNGTKATGSVNFTNTVCGAIQPPKDVSAGTGVTSNGVRFITQNNTHFSSSGTVNGSCISYPASSATSVTAQAGGTKYNLAGGSTFSVDSRSDVSGTGSTNGGTDNITTVVSQSDVDNAVAKLKGTSSTTFSATFQSQLGQQGYYVLAPTLKQADAVTTASPDVGQPASNTTVTIKITHSVLTVKKDDLKKAISNVVAKQINPAKQKIEDTDLFKGATISVANQTSPTVATLQISESASAIPILDPAAIKKQVAGKKSAAITSDISSLPGVKNVTVTFKPFWVSKAPKNASKVTINLQYVKNNSGQ